MSDFEHQLRVENQIAQLSGKQDRLIDAIQSLKGIAEKAFAPEYTLDELTIPSNIYKDFASYGYLYNYIFVGDSDAGTTLTIGNRIQTHTITLNGGWNQIHLFDNGWWKASNVINVMLLRSKKDMSTYIGGGGSSSSPLYASLTGSSAPDKSLGAVLMAPEGGFFTNPLPYTDFAANSTNYYTFIGLTPNAKRRLFLFKSTLNVNVTLSDVGISMSAIAQGSITQMGVPATGWTIASSPTTTTIDSLEFPVLGAPGDVIEVSFSVGATAATSGQLSCYVNEIV